MIIDSISNADKYFSINKEFKAVFDYLTSNNLSDAAPCTITLKKDKVWINVSEVKGKQQSEAMLERHNNFIDIQIVLNGSETYGWAGLDNKVVEASAYDIKADCQFYSSKCNLYFTQQPGTFAIFFPWDLHAPCIGEGKIKKIVAKVSFT